MIGLCAVRFSDFLNFSCRIFFKSVTSKEAVRFFGDGFNFLRKVPTFFSKKKIKTIIIIFSLYFFYYYYY